MKTAMKRLLSFVLVAMMLVSVVPFQASAQDEDPQAEPEKVKLTVVLAEDNGSWDTFGTAVEQEYDKDTELTAQQIRDLVKDQEGGRTLIGIRKDAAPLEGDKITLTEAVTVVALYQKLPEPTKEWTIKFSGDGKGKVDNLTIKSVTQPTAEAVAAAINTMLGDNSAYVPVEQGDIPEPSETTFEVELTLQTYNVTYKVVATNGADDKKVAEIEYDPEVDQHTVSKASIEAALEALMELEALDGFQYYEYDADPAAGTAVKKDTVVEIEVEVWKEFTVEFYNDINDTEAEKILTTRKHKLDKSKAPSDPKKDDYTFDRWDTATKGYELDFEDLKSTLTQDYKFYARFEKTSSTNADGHSDIEVIAKRYADGREKEEVILDLPDLENVKDGTNVYDKLRLYQKEINKAINELEWEDSEWVDNTFYMNSKGSEELDKDMELDGDCTVYVMVGEGEPIKVQLYVHTSYKKEPTYIVNMFGYESDDILKKADINETLEKKWPDRTYKWTGMYSDKDWTDILGDKEGVTAKSSYYLEKYIDPDEDQTVNVHIYATRTYVNNSDNPKTGDTILMAVTAMGLSAAALAAVYFVFKKKQSV